MMELSTDENEIKTITLKVTEQEFRMIQIKKSIKNYKKENLDLSPKNGDVLSATSKSGSSKKETKNAENDIKSEADITVTQIIHQQALQTPPILICKKSNFHQIISEP